MASSRRSSGPVLPINNVFRQSTPSSSQFCGGAVAGFPSSSSGQFASSSSFSSQSSTFFQRSASPTRVNLVGTAPSVSSVQFSIDHRPSSPCRQLTADGHVVKNPISAATSSASHRRTCMCSPTTHPGSFRCSFHKNAHQHSGNVSSSPSNRLYARRSAMTNSLVRIGIEGEWVKRALATLIRPSSHHQRRRAAFQPRPSRLSIMSNADDLRISSQVS